MREGRNRGRRLAGQRPILDCPLVNTSIPNVARIYDYLLGGKDNFAADRGAAEELLALMPDAQTACHHNRVFLQRAVRYLAGQAGIRQFIDIGTGLPTQGNVHEIAHQTAPDARVIYVDYDPMVISHAQALLATAPTVTVIHGDLRHPGKILADPGLHKLIDFSQPIARDMRVMTSVSAGLSRARALSNSGRLASFSWRPCR